ncbi:hypothetical protein [Bradyrhizobium mercantei]|nr:hypothetical protein [Bradyrhizobium mercantei]
MNDHSEASDRTLSGRLIKRFKRSALWSTLTIIWDFLAKRDVPD